MVVATRLIGSPYYWAFVVVITVAFAVVDFEALRRRTMSRMHGAAVAVYCLTWVVIAGLGLPIAPLGSLWWLFPAAVRIAAAVAFAGGSLLAELARAEQKLVHPELHHEVTYPKHKLTADELREAEAYDDEWQREDRARNRRRQEEQHRR